MLYVPASSALSVVYRFIFFPHSVYQMYTLLTLIMGIRARELVENVIKLSAAASNNYDTHKTVKQSKR